MGSMWRWCIVTWCMVVVVEMCITKKSADVQRCMRYKQRVVKRITKKIVWCGVWV